MIDSSGANAFTTGSGTQSYLKLLSASSLDASIEQLITTLPGTTTPPPGAGPSDTFDSNVLSSAWTSSSSGSTVKAANQQLEISHPAGGWTRGSLLSAAPFDATGKAVQVRVKRAANAGQGGSTYGETSVIVSIDGTHQLELFIAGGSLTAWVENGSTSTNLTPSWPRYDATTMAWLRIRESGGTVSFQYSAGTTSPTGWTTLATVAKPFALTGATLTLTAGSNVTSADTAIFDDVSTS